MHRHNGALPHGDKSLEVMRQDILKRCMVLVVLHTISNSSLSSHLWNRQSVASAAAASEKMRDDDDDGNGVDVVHFQNNKTRPGHRRDDCVH